MGILLRSLALSLHYWSFFRFDRDKELRVRVKPILCVNLHQLEPYRNDNNKNNRGYDLIHKLLSRPVTYGQVKLGAKKQVNKKKCHETRVRRSISEKVD